MAQQQNEREALTQRYQVACADLRDRCCEAIRTEFEAQVSISKAILSRSLSITKNLISDDNQLYATFYQLIDANARLPEDNEFDRARQAVDATLFPYYFQEIRFAALSIDGRGANGYGDCAIVLKGQVIESRATVFEQNSLLFCRKFLLGEPVPFGYRASWTDRTQLAVAKLHEQLKTTTSKEDFSSIVLRQTGHVDKDDFIEVHIWGSLHRRGIEAIIITPPTSAEDEILLESIRTALAPLGVIVP